MILYLRDAKISFGPKNHIRAEWSSPKCSEVLVIVLVGNQGVFSFNRVRSSSISIPVLSFTSRASSTFNRVSSHIVVIRDFPILWNRLILKGTHEAGFSSLAGSHSLTKKRMINVGLSCYHYLFLLLYCF